MNAAGKSVWFVIYNLIALPVMFLAFHAAAFHAALRGRQTKIRTGVAGRRHLFEDLHAQLHRLSSRGPCVWIHASSMGECEQAKPVLRALKARFPEVVRVLTIFSPSAHSHVARQSLPAEVSCYLPFDSLANVRRFLRLLAPAAGVVIRHDYWPNFMWLARQHGVFLLLADASVSANARSFRHKPLVRHFNREVLANFHAICAVSEAAAASLRDLVRHPDRLHLTGDTRYDQVLYRVQNAAVDRLLPEGWTTAGPLFVAGSTWPSDEAVLLPAIAAVRAQLPRFRAILVPHEPTPEHLLQLESRLGREGLPSVRLSQAGASDATVLLVDRVGILAELYAAGQVAFVGGSFGPGVHSVLEAAAHGVPVLFGPRMQNSAEAVEMVGAGLGRVVSAPGELAQELLRLMQDQTAAQAWGARCREFVHRKTGAAEKIVSLLAPRLQ